MQKNLLFLLILITINNISAQKNYWQQKANYKIEVVVDAKTYQYQGTQTLIYSNNSPDTIKKVFYHLFNNAFQPGSEMDQRLQNISDPDRRMINTTKDGEKTIKESRIKNLKPNEIGFLHITNFKQDGVLIQTKEVETILEVLLVKPILPNSKTTFSLDFSGQMPIQIRRSGRNNSEGVEMSMAQWYPKLAEYDFEGWHADPYIAREFYGVWADFDVKIKIDKDYVLGGTGNLQNPEEIGFGYQKPGTKPKPNHQKTLTWHFLASNVHDFTWAADKNYLHDIVQIPNGATLHFLYKNNPKIIDNWKKAEPKTAQLMTFYNQTIGKYPYKQYSIIQGGDGGMEYAMCTLILGEGSYDGLIGVIAHEMAHSWFQQILATNESKHPWMDEGFATFLDNLGLNEISDKKLENPFEGEYSSYIKMANSGKEQPQSTHSDRYDENRLYSTSSYSKGCVFLRQLGYLIGDNKMMETIKRYFIDFRFKHPTPNDFKRVAEKTSGAELDWYLTDWTQTTNNIDYGIKKISSEDTKTTINLERIGRMPMPIDLLITFKDGTQQSFYIPLRIMAYEKTNPDQNIKRNTLKDWTWANPNYSFTIDQNINTIKKIEIDPKNIMADINKTNNSISY